MAKSEERIQEIRFVVWVPRGREFKPQASVRIWTSVLGKSRRLFACDLERDNDPTKNIANFIAGEAQLSVRIV